MVSLCVIPQAPWYVLLLLIPYRHNTSLICGKRFPLLLHMLGIVGLHNTQVSVECYVSAK